MSQRGGNEIGPEGRRRAREQQVVLRKLSIMTEGERGGHPNRYQNTIRGTKSWRTREPRRSRKTRRQQTGRTLWFTTSCSLARPFHARPHQTLLLLPSGPAYQLGWPGETLTFAPYKTHQPMKSLMELAQSRHSNAVIASRGVSDPTLRRSYFFYLLFFSFSFSDLRHCERRLLSFGSSSYQSFPQFEATFQIRTCAKYRTADSPTN